MTPSTNSMPPPGPRLPQVFASPAPRPPTTIGVIDPAAAPPRPPPPPRPPAALSLSGGVPVGPQPAGSVDTHLRLRFLTVFVLTCFSALKRLPLRSPE